MPSTPASRGSAGTHRSSSLAPGFRRWMRLANDSVAYTVPSGAIAMSLHTPPLVGKGYVSLRGAGLQVERPKRRLSHDGRAPAAAGVVLADPERVGLVVREHAEHIGEARGRGQDPRFGLRRARRRAVDRPFRRAAEVDAAVLAGRQVFCLDAGVIDRDFRAGLCWQPPSGTTRERQHRAGRDGQVLRMVGMIWSPAFARTTGRS